MLPTKHLIRTLLCLALTLSLAVAIDTVERDAALTRSGNNLESKPDFCHDLDCPKFHTVDSTDAYEVREYSESVWVSTDVQAYAYALAVPMGFKRLFNYIDGNNADAVKIPMTSPVRVEVHPSSAQGPFCKGNFTVSFYVPKQFQEDTPIPNDSNVYISREDPFTVYVAQQGGFVLDDFSLGRMTKRLTDALDADGIEYEDTYYFAGYDAPFVVKNRHNEVWIKAAAWDELSTSAT